MCSAIIRLCQQPINPAISWEEDRIGVLLVLLPQSLSELYCNGHQLFAGVDVEEADWCSSKLSISWCQPIHYLHVTDVHMTSLWRIKMDRNILQYHVHTVPPFPALESFPE